MTQTSALELLDEVDGTLRGAATASAGEKSPAWQAILQKHPDLRDPFSRLVGWAPDLADEVLVTFTDGVKEQLSQVGLGPEDVRRETGRIQAALDQYYRLEDSAGRPCRYDKRTGTWVSSSGGPCTIQKTAGGGAALVKKLLADASKSQREDIRSAYERAVKGAMDRILSHPRQLYAKLSTAGKAIVLLSGLGAYAASSVSYDPVRQTLSIDGADLGDLELSAGKVKAYTVSLPPISAGRITVTAAGKGDERSREGSVQAVVPIRDANLSAEVARRVAEGEGTVTQVSARVSREGWSAGVSARNTPTRTDLSASGSLEGASIPGTRVKNAYIKAGVGVTRTSRGTLVEPTANVSAGFRFGSAPITTEERQEARGGLLVAGLILGGLAVATWRPDWLGLTSRE